MSTLFTVNGTPVIEKPDLSVSYLSAFTVDGDGSPRCYGPSGCKPQPLDYLANAGGPGNWWGIATRNGFPYGQPVVQSATDPFPGLYVSTTAYKIRGFSNGDPRRELNSEIVPFMVVPLRLVDAVRGVVLGCRGRITDNRTGLYVDCVVGDLGPNNHLGEASIAAASALKLPTSPKTGGSSARMFTYECWPGIAANGFSLQPAARLSVARVASLDAVANAVYVG